MLPGSLKGRRVVSWVPDTAPHASEVYNIKEKQQTSSEIRLVISMACEEEEKKKKKKLTDHLCPMKDTASRDEIIKGKGTQVAVSMSGCPRLADVAASVLHRNITHQIIPKRDDTYWHYRKRQR
ncbi:hypothetical protein E2C01_025304 [Portunus trituberculatus]|uniref:Uncharacterized protein n=1 Tax=Portunus trituberculatus TaxID=210409 RepID=A0A5B7ECZ9_PORTR|nr:hypothetical protein [Portunus trituberculatus]